MQGLCDRIPPHSDGLHPRQYSQNDQEQTNGAPHPFARVCIMEKRYWTSMSESPPPNRPQQISLPSMCWKLRIDSSAICCLCTINRNRLGRCTATSNAARKVFPVPVADMSRALDWPWQRSPLREDKASTCILLGTISPALSSLYSFSGRGSPPRTGKKPEFLEKLSMNFPVLIKPCATDHNSLSPGLGELLLGLLQQLTLGKGYQMHIPLPVCC